jgi:hypothetical protein
LLVPARLYGIRHRRPAQDTLAGGHLLLLPSVRPKGLVILLPSFGERPELLLQNTALPRELTAAGYSCVVFNPPQEGQYMGFDSLSQHQLDRLISFITRQPQNQNTAFFLGGFSIGGSCAVKYAECAGADPMLPQPKAIFAIDPPLDFARFYQAAIRNIRLASQGHQQPSGESVYMRQRIRQEMGGTPDEAPEQYFQRSPYSALDTIQRALLPLRKTPLLFFSEPDVDWWLQERGMDVSNMNITDISGLVNELHRLGNTQVQLKITSGKGYRQRGSVRHPHSWSIADPGTVINWLNRW